MKRLSAFIFLTSCLLHSGCASSAGTHPAQRFVDQFWRASTPDQQLASSHSLAEESTDASQLYGWLKAGPRFEQNVARGEIDVIRIGKEGRQFPYSILVPPSYDPKIPIQVEFNLHGGVGRPEPLPGKSFWRNGNAQLADPNRIVVLPGAWQETPWWYSNQAENIKAILNEIKQQYNVDDNRVYLTGVSDGGTGSYFFAFKQPSEWAAFLPYIGNPGVLSNRASPQRHILYYENLRDKPLFIVNGENDPLYPASGVLQFIDRMEEAGIDYTYTVIANGGHDTRWMPELKPHIERFKQAAVRDPLPDSIIWTTNQVEYYSRYHWVVVQQIRARGEPATIEITRTGNDFEITTNYVRKFTLLLNPEEVDFTQPITARVNGEIVHNALVPQSEETLLKWATEDRDRSMLFSAELTLLTPQ
jgi:poly(3-hydroxybutyrate) depolymerase